MERKEGCRKLPLKSFLSRPVSRLGRYPMLIQSLLKYTAQDHADTKTFTQVHHRIKQTLETLNYQAGKADNALRLNLLSETLVLKDTEEEYRSVLNLLRPERVFLREGVLKKRGSVENQDVDLILLDHYLLITKKKIGREGTCQYRLVREVMITPI